MKFGWYIPVALLVSGVGVLLSLVLGEETGMYFWRFYSCAVLVVCTLAILDRLDEKK